MKHKNSLCSLMILFFTLGVDLANILDLGMTYFRFLALALIVVMIIILLIRTKLLNSIFEGIRS